MRSEHAFVYIRGEAVHAIRRVTEAVIEAHAKGYLGKNILGSGLNCDITVMVARVPASWRRNRPARFAEVSVASRGLSHLSLRRTVFMDAPTVVNNVGTLPACRTSFLVARTGSRRWGQRFARAMHVLVVGPH